MFLTYNDLLRYTTGFAYNEKFIVDDINYGVLDYCGPPKTPGRLVRVRKEEKKLGHMLFSPISTLMIIRVRNVPNTQRFN